MKHKQKAKSKKQKGIRQRGGFTLIEVIVAIGVFSILFAIAAGGFLSALRAERQAAALLAAESNASIALERIAREIRTGYYFCENAIIVPPPCAYHIAPDGTTVIYDNLEYYDFSSHKIDYTLQNGVLMRAEDDGTPEPLTG